MPHLMRAADEKGLADKVQACKDLGFLGLRVWGFRVWGFRVDSECLRVEGFGHLSARPDV